MAEKLEKKKPKPSERSSLLVGLVDRLLPLLVVAAALCLLVILYAAVSGQLASFPQTAKGELTTPVQQAAFRDHMGLVCRLLAVSVWLLALLAFARYYLLEEMALGFGSVGLLLMLGLPWLLQGTTGDGPGLVPMVAGSLRVTGQFLLTLSLLRFGVGLSYHVFVRKPNERKGKFTHARPVFTHPERKAKDPEEKLERRSLFRHCWELSQCKGSLRVNCPNYRSHTDCWKAGSGCQCSPVLARHLVEELDLELSHARSEEERRAVERMKENVLFRTKHDFHPELCRQCELLNEHQAHKFKALYWISYPIGIVVTTAALPLIHRGYAWAIKVTDALFGAMQLLPDNRASLEPFVSSMAEYSLEPVAVFSVGLIIVSYLLDAMDWLIFEVKL